MRKAATICPRPLQVDLWPFDLESGVRVTSDMGYLCANFGLHRPLCSRLRPYVRDRQTSDRQTSDAHHRLMPPPYWGGGIKQCGQTQIYIYTPTRKAKLLWITYITLLANRCTKCHGSNISRALDSAFMQVGVNFHRELYSVIPAAFRYNFWSAGNNPWHFVQRYWLHMWQKSIAMAQQGYGIKPPRNAHLKNFQHYFSISLQLQLSILLTY